MSVGEQEGGPVGIAETDPELAERHPDARGERMLHAFAMLVECQGGRVQRARCEGYEAPNVTSGNVSPHRFDLFGSWPAGDKFFVEVVPRFVRVRTVQLRRWYLLQSAAAQVSAKIYFVVASQRERDFLRATLAVREFAVDAVLVVEPV